MRSLSFIQLFFVAVCIIFVSSCETLPDETPVSIPPSIDLLADAGFIATDATIAAGETINVRIKGTKGDASLSSLEMLIDGARFTDPAADITVNGAAASSSAPVLFDTDKEGFTWDIAIKPHESGTASYSFVLTDDAGETSSTFVDVTVESTPLEVTTDVSAVTLPADVYQPVTITVTAGSSQLNTITVSEDGVAITDLNRLKIGDLVSNVCWASNPLTLEGDDKDGLTMDLKLRAHSTVGSVTYTITVEDDAGGTASTDVTMTVEATGTPIDAILTQRLIENAAGPNPTGGLDLSLPSDNTVSVNSADADIIDSGIDGTDQTNWIGSIKPANGASLRRVDSNQPELFDFDNIATKEEVIAAYGGGVEIAESAVVVVGDIFMVQDAAGNHFILKTTKVEETTTNNLDYYEFTVKQALN